MSKKMGGTKAMTDYAFDFKNNAWSLRWKELDNPINNYPNNHRSDVSILMATASMNLSTAAMLGKRMDQSSGYGFASINHGDRWHIADLDPKRPGLEGFALEQTSGYDWYYYDAKSRHVLRKGWPGTSDMGAGIADDVDPTHLGYEMLHER